MASEPDHVVLASDAERERAVDLLRIGSTQGRLTVDELEQRTATALSARTRGELERLTLDLPPSAPTRRRESAAHPRRQAHPPRHRPPRDQLVAYVAVSLLLVAVWAATGAGYFWPIWPILGWGIGLAKHIHRRGPMLPPPRPADRPGLR